jgi:hypothetical protein
VVAVAASDGGVVEGAGAGTDDGSEEMSGAATDGKSGEEGVEGRVERRIGEGPSGRRSEFFSVYWEAKHRRGRGLPDQRPG